MNNLTELVQRYEKAFNVYQDFAFKEPDKNVVKKILLIEIKSLQKQVAELSKKRTQQTNQREEILEVIEEAKRKITAK